MDVRINAQGRIVEILGVDEGSAEEIAEVALDLWLSLEIPSKKDIEAGSVLTTDRAHIPLGFADFALEPPDVK